MGEAPLLTALFLPDGSLDLDWLGDISGKRSVAFGK
jgi:hypothetical protein